MRGRAPTRPRPRPRPPPRGTRSRARPASCGPRRPTSRSRTARSAGCSAGRSTRASCPSTPGGGARSKSPRWWIALDLLEAERAAEVELRCRTRRARSARARSCVLVELQPLAARARATRCQLHALRLPVLEPLHVVRARLDEELHLHLLELARAEDEVPGRDLVAERLADLRDAERHLLPRRLLHVQEVHVDALRRLRAQVDDGRACPRRAP